MANELSLFDTGPATLPAHLKGVEVDEQTRKLAGGGGGLRISIKGGVWRLLNNGVELQRNEDRYMNMIVVKASPDTARTFYDGTFSEDEIKPPTCWSADGVTPAGDVKTKQSVSCALCPQNVAGSGEGDSRACRYSRHLAVTLENDQSGKVFKISLPAQSLFGKPENNVMPLQAYAKQLTQHNVPISAVVTEFRFDTSSATPKIGFKAKRFLTPEEYALAKAQGESPAALDAIASTSFSADGGAKPLDIAGSSPVDKVPADAGQPSVVVQEPATVAATPPVTQVRKRVKPTPAPAAEPTEAPLSEVEAMRREMAKMAAVMAAMEGGKPADLTDKQPVVVESSKPAAGPLPASAADMLSKWEMEDE